MSGSGTSRAELQSRNQGTRSENETQAPSYSQVDADLAPGIEAAFPYEFPEGRSYLECVEGRIPSFVRGVYYLNGPARFGSKELRYQNWLDGDGMVCALSFAGDKVQLTNRYVRSTKFLTEQNSEAPVFRAFGTAFPGSRLNRANNGLESPVNVSVYPFANRLLAFGEQGLPWELDPSTLATVGQFTFGGRLNEASPFSAHPKFDPHTHEMFNFGIFFSSHSPKLYLYCFDRDTLRFRKGCTLDYPCSVHDFALSTNYAVFYLSPYLLDISKLLQGNQAVIDSLRWEPVYGSKILILSRSSGEIVASIPNGDRYCLHLINAFEDGNDLYLDVLEFPEPIYPQYQPLPHLFRDVAMGCPTRLCVDLEKSQVRNRSYFEYCQAPDFPTIDPRRAMQQYEDFWMLGISSTGRQGRKFFDELVHASWRKPGAIDIYRTPATTYLGGEPVFIGDTGSDQGVVVCQEFAVRTEQSYFLLFDAHHVCNGPIARIPVPQPLYLGFHAAFHANYF